MRQHSFHVSLPEEVYHELDEQAQEHGITTATLIRLIVVHAHRNNVEVMVYRDDISPPQRRKK